MKNGACSNTRHAKEEPTKTKRFEEYRDECLETYKKKAKARQGLTVADVYAIEEMLNKHAQAIDDIRQFADYNDIRLTNLQQEVDSLTKESYRMVREHVELMKRVEKLERLKGKPSCIPHSGLSFTGTPTCTC